MARAGSARAAAALLLLAAAVALGLLPGCATAQRAQMVLDTDPKEQLFQACQNGNKGEVAMALTNGADINAKDMGDLTALHYAAQKGHDSIARILIEDGARVNALSVDKTTPLMLAVEYAQLKVVKLLLRKGADADLLDKSGADALHRACFITNPEAPAILKALLEHSNTHVNRADRDGKTPVALACERGNWDAVAQLVAAGADPNQRVGDQGDAAGPTPLMVAAMHGQAEAVRQLLDAGASVHALDGQWNGVLTYAQYGKDNKVSAKNGGQVPAGADYDTTVELLLQHGAFYDDVKIRMATTLATVVILTLVIVFFFAKSKPSRAVAAADSDESKPAAGDKDKAVARDSDGDDGDDGGDGDGGDGGDDDDDGNESRPEEAAPVQTG